MTCRLSSACFHVYAAVYCSLSFCICWLYNVCLHVHGFHNYWEAGFKDRDPEVLGACAGVCCMGSCAIACAKMHIQLHKNPVKCLKSTGRRVNACISVCLKSQFCMGSCGIACACAYSITYEPSLVFQIYWEGGIYAE